MKCIKISIPIVIFLLFTTIAFANDIMVYRNGNPIFFKEIEWGMSKKEVGQIMYENDFKCLNKNNNMLEVTFEQDHFVDFVFGKKGLFKLTEYHTLGGYYLFDNYYCMALLEYKEPTRKMESGRNKTYQWSIENGKEIYILKYADYNGERIIEERANLRFQ